MTITAKVIADSIGYKGKRITTFSLHYPRFIHSELMTHRVFSRNSSSSRAIPIQKMIEKVINDPAVPVFWGKNQAGMQARESLTGWRLSVAKNIWLWSRWIVIFFVRALHLLGLHKQITNRLLEPWMHQDTVLTATEWGNWYNLRNHPDAQPEIKQLAEAMLEAHNKSQPAVLTPGAWHLPYVFPFEKRVLSIKDQLICSTARCARVSYMNHEGRPTTLEEDTKTFERLLGGNPKHASPAEHQAKYPLPLDLVDGYIWPHLESNLDNWVQHRKIIKGENMPVYEGLNG
jgi:hypothetical protein